MLTSEATRPLLELAVHNVRVEVLVAELPPLVRRRPPSLRALSPLPLPVHLGPHRLDLEAQDGVVAGTSPLMSHSSAARAMRAVFAQEDVVHRLLSRLAEQDASPCGPLVHLQAVEDVWRVHPHAVLVPQGPD